MKIKRIILNNSGLKITALFIAFGVWLIIAGQERSYLERSFEVNIEYFNVSKNIDVRNVRTEKVRIKLKGPSNELKGIDSENFKLRIDLAGINESTRLNLFSEDYLEFPKLPEGIKIVSIHPKMLEITVAEFMSKEVSVRVLYSGKLKKGIRLIERRVEPEKVTIFGYKSRIENITTVFAAGKIDLSEITESKAIKLPLKKSKEIIRFEKDDQVEIFIKIESRYDKKE